MQQVSEEDQIDVLSPQYQKEIELISKKLAQFKPDAIAVSYTHLCNATGRERQRQAPGFSIVPFFSSAAVGSHLRHEPVAVWV